MAQSRSELVTEAFYRWEVPLRGWSLYPVPVQLEPPFAPFWYYYQEPDYSIDDGRTNIISIVSSFLKPKNEPEVIEELSPVERIGEEELLCFRLSLSKQNQLDMSSSELMLNLLSGSQYPLSFELHGDSEKITVQIVCDLRDEFWLDTTVKSLFPTIQIQKEDATLPFDWTEENIAIVDFGLNDEVMRPILSKHSDLYDPYAHFFSLCDHLNENEHIVLQSLFKGVSAPWSYQLSSSVGIGKNSFFDDAPEMPILAQEKTQSPLFASTLRIAVNSQSQERSREISRLMAQNLVSSSRSEYNHLIPLSNEGYAYDHHAYNLQCRRSNRTGMLLSASELLSFVHLPSSMLDVQKLSWRFTTSSVPESMIGNPYILGETNGTDVSVNDAQRNRHSHVLGVSGVGKSTFLANLLLQDAEYGNPFILLDPHGDIVDDVLLRIPDHRIKDVILIDPSLNNFNLGWNILEAKSEQEKMIISSDLIEAFKRESSSWGDVINSVFSNAIYAFLESSQGGSLLDLKRFLVEESFREEYLKTIDDEQLHYYWEREFPLLKPSAISPLLTRLDTFLRPKVIRKVLTQKQGINIGECIENNKILLIKLAQGEMGESNSRILGTLFISKIYQSFLARQSIPKELRHFVPFVIDECHNYITHTITQMLSGARKYGLGLHLAHQNYQQLKPEYIQTIDANTSIKVFFRLGYADINYATKLFDQFDDDDFQSLSRGEALVRVGVKTDVVKVSTPPPSETRYSNISEIISLLDQSDGATGEPNTKHENADQTPLIVTELPSIKEDIDSEAQKFIQQTKEREAITLHRRIQNELKKCGQDNGFQAILEAPAGDNRKVDVLLTKDDLSIAIEISVTNTVNYEIQNLHKCIEAGVDLVVMVSSDERHLSQIQEKFKTEFGVNNMVQFLNIEGAIDFISHKKKPDLNKEFHLIKGYRVKVKYEK